MGRPRSELHALLKEITPNVYFQPPENIKMQYPCIVYARDYANTMFAGNLPYRTTKRYLVTVIDADPDSPIPDEIAKLPFSSFNRYFAADSLNHDVFRVYY